jgi:CRISPR-associated protein Csm1
MTEKERKYGIILGALLNDIGKLVWQVNTEFEEIKITELSNKFFYDYIADKTCIRPIKDFVSNILLQEEEGNFTSVLKASNLFKNSEGIIASDKKLRRPLVSVLSRVDFKQSGKPLPDNIYSYTPKILDITNVFPKKETSGNFDKWEINESELINNLQSVYNSFVNEIKSIPDTEISAFTDSLLFTYEKHLAYINSSITAELSDISLFDHSKTVAALSVCKEFAEEQVKPFLIVAADISGIQKFIYSETESKKSKKLRGRSLYVGLMTELFSDYLLREFDLPRTNILLNGGGHFVMIFPNNAENKEKLSKIENKIQKWYYETFKGEINLVIKSIEADDELYKNFPKWYNEISSLLLKAKNRKGETILTNCLITILME